MRKIVHNLLIFNVILLFLILVYYRLGGFDETELSFLSSVLVVHFPILYFTERYFRVGRVGYYFRIFMLALFLVISLKSLFAVYNFWIMFSLIWIVEISFGIYLRTEIQKERTSQTTLPKQSTTKSPESNLPRFYEDLNKMLNDEQLKTFCLLYFEKVHNNFADGQTKIAKITMLLEYVQQNDLHQKLTSNLAEFLKE